MNTEPQAELFRILRTSVCSKNPLPGTTILRMSEMHTVPRLRTKGKQPFPSPMYLNTNMEWFILCMYLGKWQKLTVLKYNFTNLISKTECPLAEQLDTDPLLCERTAGAGGWGWGGCRNIASTMQGLSVCRDECHNVASLDPRAKHRRYPWSHQKGRSILIHRFGKGLKECVVPE